MARFNPSSANGACAAATTVVILLCGSVCLLCACGIRRPGLASLNEATALISAQSLTGEGALSPNIQPSLIRVPGGPSFCPDFPNPAYGLAISAGSNARASQGYRPPGESATKVATSRYYTNLTSWDEASMADLLAALQKIERPGGVATGELYDAAKDLKSDPFRP